LIAKADSVLRAIAIEQATKSKQYLDDELAKTSTLEVRESMYRLIEAQVQTIMLAQVRENYAFKVIDKARVPDRDDYVRPRRLIIVLAGAVLGLMLAGALGLLLDSGAVALRRFGEKCPKVLLMGRIVLTG
jgi:LPS O-antigen subunit length determinant protein (WzzB/FepE family)